MGYYVSKTDEKQILSTLAHEEGRPYFVTIGKANAPKAVVAQSALEAIFKVLLDTGVKVEVGTVHNDGSIL